MRPTYPLTRFLLEPSQGDSSVVQRRSDSGRVRTYDLGVYTDHAVTLTHSLLRSAVVEEVMDFWRANRGQLINVESDMGEYWVGAFLARPRREHVDGHWWNLVVEMMRYAPEEGGL